MLWAVLRIVERVPWIRGRVMWLHRGFLWIFRRIRVVLWIHRWAPGGSVVGSGTRGGSGAGGKSPDPSALMETPLDYATPAAARNLC